jgi:hypothetical protein
MHNINDIDQNVIICFLYLAHNCKLNKKNLKSKIINQHMNATCQMKSLHC